MNLEEVSLFTGALNILAKLAIVLLGIVEIFSSSSDFSSKLARAGDAVPCHPFFVIVCDNNFIL